MAYRHLPAILRCAKVFTWFFLLGAGVLTLTLFGKMVDVSGEPEIRLALDTTRPNLFGVGHDMNEGFRRGQAAQAAEASGPLASLSPAKSFEMVADPHISLLRYREPSAWKRAALLALGALDGSLSVAGLLFLGYGSWLLLKLLQDVTPETPFTLANAQRLRKLTLLVLGMHYWQYVAYLLLRTLVPAYHLAQLAHPLSHYVRLNTDELVPGLAVGFILAIITAVYQRGVELSHEAALVI